MRTDKPVAHMHGMQVQSLLSHHDLDCFSSAHLWRVSLVLGVVSCT